MSEDHFQTSQTLLLRIREPSDAGAWGEFARLYTPLLRKFALLRGVEAQDVDDLVQEVLKTVSQAIRGFEYDAGRGTFRDWLFIVTRSKVARHFKKAARQPSGSGGETVRLMLEEQPAPEEERDWDLEYRRRMFAWAAEIVQKEVSEKTWRAFWMMTVEEKTAADAAKTLGMTAGAAYVAKSRVIARMRERIASVAGEHLDEKPPADGLK
ncbi:MAG: sigma-70 family RNA polymerase sigma factor [Verrucomicrobiaceae bacterium]|nr:sigma-70 family RNA polymerase sigma factor [Verrucomicrobiaceae bacterium]